MVNQVHSWKDKMCFKCVIESQVPFSLFFQILAPIYLSVYLSIYRQLTLKGQFHSRPKERQCQRMFKLPHTKLISQVSKVSSKFSKPGFNNTWTENSQMFKLDLKKAEEPEIQLPISVELKKKKEDNSRKSSASLTMLKTLTTWISTNYEKLLKRWE